MPSLVQQSTTQLALKFMLVLASDHISPATGLTPTVTIRKEGGAFAAPTGAVTEIANGWYQVAANATDTNTFGDILLHATGTGADPTDVVAATVVAFNPQTANLGLSNVSSNVTQINGVSTSAVTTVNANVGTTQPINFTGTGGSAQIQSDLSVAEEIAIADAILDRDMTAGTDSGSPTVRTVRQALRFLRNKWSISGSTLTVTKEDDATASWTSSLTTTPGADPITGFDPAG